MRARRRRATRPCGSAACTTTRAPSQPGDLFVARRGEKVDGARFVRGRDRARRGGGPGARGARRRAAARRARRRRRRPRARRSASRRRPSTGTRRSRSRSSGSPGTNGKTTTAHLVARRDRRRARARALRRARDGRAPLRRRGRRHAEHTTPEADELARAMAAMRARGATHVAMEVSSHALALGRVRGGALPRRRVHQPHAGPPRLPRLDGGLRRRQGAALHGARAGRGGPERRRRVRRASWPGGCKAPLVRVSARPDAAATDAEIAPREVALRRARASRAIVRTPAGDVSLALAPRRGAQPREPARRAGHRARARARSSGARPRRSRASRARPGASSGATAPATT